jgi:phospholipid/cholesterol/gamma-HCH transport system substrate-binding protein
VRSLVTDNRAALRESVGRVTSVSDQLAKKQVQLANILHLAPTTLANFYNIYDPTAGSLTGRLALGQTMGLANVTCQAMFSAGGTLEDCKRALGPLLDLFNMESLPISANPLNQPGTPNQDTPAPPPAPAKPVTPLVDGLLDLLLGGRS